MLVTASLQPTKNVPPFDAVEHIEDHAKPEEQSQKIAAWSTAMEKEAVQSVERTRFMPLHIFDRPWMLQKMIKTSLPRQQECHRRLHGSPISLRSILCPREGHIKLHIRYSESTPYERNARKISMSRGNCNQREAVKLDSIY
jgi:hypothetical protein